MKFKIGDKVKRINTRNGDHNVGDEGIVTKYDGVQYTLDKGCKHDEHNLELVKSVELIFEIY